MTTIAAADNDANLRASISPLSPSPDTSAKWEFLKFPKCPQNPPRSSLSPLPPLLSPISPYLSTLPAKHRICHDGEGGRPTQLSSRRSSPAIITGQPNGSPRDRTMGTQEIATTDEISDVGCARSPSSPSLSLTPEFPRHGGGVEDDRSRG
ncbi:hypothetical protein TIFTF001_014794 [Ficus carica]|uniref:Uncharacterized protein n=1 Tax=Ficus carica TaxID=3494 RepID=A0AA88D797_FICCA|nr:hypothetical protein TIFTF001_014794 [Ficus carica]